MYQAIKQSFFLLILFAAIVLFCCSGYIIGKDLLDSMSADSSHEYDYEALQMQITVAPFDRLEPPKYDAHALRQENPDFQGWLQIPDMAISLPVVQGTDNGYYLKHSFSRARSSFGCLFLEYDTQDTDRNLVIHGHNMGINREEMFSTLVNYQDQSFADAHKTIFYSDPDKPGKERYTLFAVLNLDIQNEDGFQYRQQTFSDDNAFQEYVAYLKKHSIYTSDYVPTGETIILSTCNRPFGDSNRLLICAGRDAE